MADMQHQGVMAMVKIDGDKVKLLREQNGLTQLYVATAVQVTTDTISRWENKRYPTIKKENAIRLAEALEVELDDILIPETPPPSESPEHQVNKATEIVKARPTDRWRLILLGSSVIALLVFGLAIFIWFNTKPVTTISAQRLLPGQCTLNQPFPVKITIDVNNQGELLSVIVKENLPENIVVLQVKPDVPTGVPETGTLKWLKRIQGKESFIYVIASQSPSSMQFTGSISTGNNGGQTTIISGPDTLLPSQKHWADTDGDNVINDLEILTVYDRFGDLEDLGLNIDLIEEIWLGSGYSYNETTKKYDILP